MKKLSKYRMTSYLEEIWSTAEKILQLALKEKKGNIVLKEHATEQTNTWKIGYQ